MRLRRAPDRGDARRDGRAPAGASAIWRISRDRRRTSATATTRRGAAIWIAPGRFPGNHDTRSPGAAALLRLFRRSGRAARAGLLRVHRRRLADHRAQQRAGPADVRELAAAAVAAQPSSTTTGPLARWPTGTIRCSARVPTAINPTFASSGECSRSRRRRRPQRTRPHLRAVRAAGCRRPAVTDRHPPVHRRARAGRISIRLGPPKPNSERRAQRLRHPHVTLSADSYQWDFRSVGNTFSDPGTGTCH